MNNKGKILSVGLISMFLVSSCVSSSTLKLAKSKQISSGDTISAKSIVYGLPKSTLVFKINQVKTEYKAGPFAKFAETFLGIENVILDNKASYQLSCVVIDQYRELDNDALFIVEPGDEVINYLQLSKQGLIMFPESRTAKPLFQTESKDYSQNLIFTDLSVKPNYFSEKGEVTSVSDDMSAAPVLRKQVVQKSISDKAKEAADVIFEIRDRRLSILFGDEDKFPEGEAMKADLDELNRIEKEYLALFIGKKIESTTSFYYEFSPTQQYLTNPYLIFRFSETTGITDVNSMEGRPIFVVIEKDAGSVFDSLHTTVTENNGHSIYYRIPSSVNVKLIDKSVIAQRRIVIEQLGKLMAIPAKNINL